jgi:PTS system cellobiose-specific IIB component
MSERSVKVLLICAGGFSSSLLLSKIRNASKAAGVALEVSAYHSSGLLPWDYEKNPIDIVLIAPQIRLFRRGISREAEPFGTIVECVDPMAYGMADGPRILKQILAALKINNPETSSGDAN